MSREQANKDDEKTARGKDTKKRKPRAKSPRKVGVYTNNVLEALGLDTNNLPSNVKLLMRGDIFKGIPYRTFRYTRRKGFCKQCLSQGLI